ncbi:unnamed protein product, partial [Schistosoma rodhaini]
MKEHEALCTIVMHKSNSNKCKSISSSSSTSSSVRWLIPIKGIPEMKSLSYPSLNEFNTSPIIIHGTVRSKSYFIITLRLFNTLIHTETNLSFDENIKDIEVRVIQSEEDKKLFNEKMFNNKLNESSSLLLLHNHSTILDQIKMNNLEWIIKPIINNEDEKLMKLINLEKILIESLFIKLFQIKNYDHLKMTEIQLGMIFSPVISF